jgi:hypothetical protein
MESKVAPTQPHADDAEPDDASRERPARALDNFMKAPVSSRAFDNFVKTSWLSSRAFDNFMKAKIDTSTIDRLVASKIGTSAMDRFVASKVDTSKFDTIIKSKVDTSALTRFVASMVGEGGATRVDTSALDRFVTSMVDPSVFDGLVKSILGTRAMDDIARQLATELTDAVREVAADAPETLIERVAPARRGFTLVPQDLGNGEWLYVAVLAEVVRQFALEQPDISQAQAALIVIAAIWLLSNTWARDKRNQA